MNVWARQFGRCHDYGPEDQINAHLTRLSVSPTLKRAATLEGPINPGPNQQNGPTKLDGSNKGS